MLPPRLSRFTDEIRSIDPDRQTIEYNAYTWLRRLNDDEDVRTLVAKFPTNISRRDLRILSRESRSDPTRTRQLFIATMIWGFGTDNRGPYKTEIMLNDVGCQETSDTCCPNVLERTVGLLEGGQVLSAYRDFCIKMCGPAFLTKYLYAVGLGVRTTPAPLVLDSLVGHAWKMFHRDGDINYSDYIWGLSPESDDREFIMRHEAGYLRYVRTMDEWASEIGCRADCIEMFLFNPPQSFWS